jgi:glycine cleavage system H lipoate-binding protein
MLAHVIFLSLFYAVLATICLTLTVAFLRAVSVFRARSAEAVCWHATFTDLPARERVCRHQFTGEFQHRTCEQAFDCRQCQQHAALIARRPPETEAVPDRFYHRGHTWARPEPDGTVTIGLDQLGESLAAHPDALELPAIGSRIQVNGAAWHVRKRGADLRILSPVDGEIVATGGTAEGWYLKVKPEGGVFDGRHLLRGAEIRPWMAREMERLHAAMAPAGQVPTMADGGAPVADIAEAVSDAGWEALCGEIFLLP